MTCFHCYQASRPHAQPYPIWSVHCDSCNRRALAMHPPETLRGFFMAILIERARGTRYVNSLLREHELACKQLPLLPAPLDLELALQ